MDFIQLMLSQNQMFFDLKVEFASSDEVELFFLSKKMMIFKRF